MLETSLFEQVADAVRSLTHDVTEPPRLRWHRRGVKAWFGDEKPTRAHYEAQIVPRRHVDGVEGLAIEIGFHAEHKEPERNDEVLRLLLAQEDVWRKELGNEVEAGVFLGAENWRRVSDVWLEPDLDDPELAVELAARLVDYLQVLEPLLAPVGPNG